MAKVPTIVFTAALCMMLFSTTPHAQTLSCNTVVDSLLPCETYLTQGGTVPESCCNGIRSLDSAANTTAERQAACNCIKAVAKAYGVDAQYASALPGECGVDIGYDISYNTDCTKVQ